MVRLFRDPPIIAKKAESVGAHEHSSLLSLNLERSLPCFESYQFVAWDLVDYGPWRNGQQVWVCKSKGRKKNQSISGHDCAGGAPDDDDDDHDDDAGPPAATQRHRRPELFLRARILCVKNNNDDDSDSDRRILVQYPAGSTYRVRRELLVPILDADTIVTINNDAEIFSDNKSDDNDNHNNNRRQNNKRNWIVVYGETSEYRRACVTHTGPNEDFLEIGCAQGVTCHRVQVTGETRSRSNASTTANNNNQHAQQRRRRTVVGLDKSELSIDTARQRYPECHFLTADVLEVSSNGSGDDAVDRLSPPAVVALDVNGNREREAVLQCLQAVLSRWEPRLVLVKSRALYHCTAGHYGNTA